MYKNDKNKIINELHFIEATFIELYNEAKSLKEELNRRKDESEELRLKNDEIRLLREQVKHYEQLYNQQMVSSAFPHLQSQNQIKDNLIQFDKNNRNHTSLENLGSLFETEETNPPKKIQTFQTWKIGLAIYSKRTVRSFYFVCLLFK